jgi:hypothetical protein
MELVDKDIRFRVVPNVTVCVPLEMQRLARRPRVVLPFGARVPRRHRQQPQIRRAVAHPVDSCTDSDSSSSSSHSSTTSSSSSSSSSSVSSTGSNSLSPNSHSEPEVPEAVACEIEQAEVEALRGHANVAAASTFFNSHVGVLDFSISPGRGKPAACYHCGDKIGRGVARFTYSYNVRRPWKYIHEGCLVFFLNALASPQAVAQAVAFCQDFTLKFHQPEQLRDLISQVLLQLAHSPSSSSRHS